MPRQAVHQEGQHRAGLHSWLQLHARGDHRIQCVQMELVRKYLYDRVHQIGLRDLILAIDHLLENPREDRLLIKLQVHPLQLAQHQQVLSYQIPQFVALLFSLILQPLRTLVLHAHPKLVHFREVVQQKIYSILYVTAFALVHAAFVGQPVLGHLGEVCSQEESAQWMLHAARHFDDIFKNVLGGRLFGLYKNSPHRDQQVQAREDVSSVLHELVQFRNAPPLRCKVAEEVLEVTHLVASLHVQRIIFLRGEL
mmetsp:Transcript_16437/g.27644  ORF Transcript_16437/g.27644 Transcript_16437/m.27644 type:complete len:253 (-) Transcript_16437:268-1026(-)